MDANIQLKFNNTYDIRLIDSRTNVVKQQGVFHNIPTVGLGSMLVGKSSISTTPAQGDANDVRDILRALSCGDGTATPQYTDTKLGHELWRVNGSITAYNREYIWLDNYTVRATDKFIFPASSSYVGTVTEVGLRGVGTTTICTRALLTDSEGQLISFNKTDIDVLEITVTVEISLVSASPDFTIIPKAPLLKLLIGEDTYLGGRYTPDYWHLIGCFGFLRFDRELFDPELPSYIASTQSFYEQVGGHYIYPASDGTLGSMYNTNEISIQIKNSRVLADTIPDDRYFDVIALYGIGFWRLPNENIFPAYTIRNIPIGTGDGITTTFQNPMNYFKKDTQKVYKNGVELVPEVDYTIDNIGNKDCLLELDKMLKIKRVYSDFPYNTSGENQPFFMHSDRAILTRNTVTEDRDPMGFNVDYPLFVEYEEPVTLNRITCRAVGYTTAMRGWYKLNNGFTEYSGVYTGTGFTLLCSTDGVDYQEVTTWTLDNSDGTFDISFADTTAKYWQLQTDFKTPRSGYEGCIRLYKYSNYNANYRWDLGFLGLHRVKPDIVFTQAPAEGEVLTMDVDMDLIFKNKNFVIDSEYAVYYNIS